MDLGIPLKMEEERSRNKERLEASLTWLCELEILKQRQESLVLGALSLGDSVPGYPAWGDVGPARSSREQEQLTLRRQLVGATCSPMKTMLLKFPPAWIFENCCEKFRNGQSALSLLFRSNVQERTKTRR